MDKKTFKDLVKKNLPCELFVREAQDVSMYKSIVEVSLIKIVSGNTKQKTTIAIIDRIESKPTSPISNLNVINEYNDWLTKARAEAEEEVVSPEVEKDYQEFWKFIVEKDGKVDMKQVKKELYDWHFAMGEVAKVYCEVTGGLLSKPMYYAEGVIDAYRTSLERLQEDWEEDYESDLKNEIADLQLSIRLLRKKLRAKNKQSKKT